MNEPLPPEFWQGVDQFNQGEFYACHDTLEAIWIPAVGPEKPLYQGIIQIAVAIYHLSNLNWRGAVILMGEGLNRLRDYPDEYEGLDLGQLRQDVAELLETLQNLGADRVAEFAWANSSDPQNLSPSAEPSDTRATIAKVSRSRPIIQNTIASLGN
jgi:uncharacterized protein